MKGTSRKWLQGLAISRGLVVGKIAKASRTPEFARSPLIVNSADTEWQKYLGAQENALRLIESLSVEACPRKPTTSPAEQSDLNPDQRSKDDSDSMPVVMTSYGMILSDELLMEKIRTFVFHESNDATTAILRAFKDIRSVVESMQDQYLRDKSLDLDACEELLLSAMSDSKSLNEKKSEHLKARIVVINHPTPQDIIRFHQVGVAGIIAEQGAQLSHAAILARSLTFQRYSLQQISIAFVAMDKWQSLMPRKAKSS